MASFNKINVFVQDLANGKHNLGSDVLKIALSNVAPIAANSIFSDVTEIAAGNGYTAGGTAITITSSTQTAGLYKLLPTSVVTFTATGAMAAFRYCVIYNSTQATPLKPLIGWYDFGSSVSLVASDTFTVSLDLVQGVLQLQ